MSATAALLLFALAIAQKAYGCPFASRHGGAADVVGAGSADRTQEPGAKDALREETMVASNGVHRRQTLNSGKEILFFPEALAKDEGIGPKFPCPLDGVQVGQGPVPAQRVTKKMRNCFIREITKELSAINSERRKNGDTQTVTANILRMAFHDCGPGHCDGSLVLNKREALHPNNHLLEGAAPIARMKDRVKRNCAPHQISWADTIVLATCIGIAQQGGPDMRKEIPLGRGDSSEFDGVDKLPAPTMNTKQLLDNFKNIFGEKASLSDVVYLVTTLSGAHTIGVASCRTFQDRLRTGLPEINRRFQLDLRRLCTKSCISRGFDSFTDGVFDNKYYVSLSLKKGVLFSDQSLFSTDACVEGVCTKAIVNAFARDQALFFRAFKWAFCQLTKLGTNLKCPFPFQPIP